MPPTSKAPETPGEWAGPGPLRPALASDSLIAAMRATHMPMVLTNPRRSDNPIAFANDAFCRLTGYPRAEVIGRNCRFLQGPGTDTGTARRLADAVAAQQAIVVDVLNYRKNGQPFWNRLSVAPVADAVGQLAYFFASQLDVTAERERVAGLESRNAELSAAANQRLRDLSDSEQRMKLATEAGGIGVWELALGTGALITSRLCKENFGRDAALPFTYDELREAVHPDDRERMAATLAHSVATGAKYGTEYRVVHPDGRIAWVQVSGCVLHDAEGRAVRMVGTSRDVTASHAASERREVLLALDTAGFGALDDPADIAQRAAQALGQMLNVGRVGYGVFDKAAGTLSIACEWLAPGVGSLAGFERCGDYAGTLAGLVPGQAVVIANAEADARTAPVAAALAQAGVASLVNAPVDDVGGVVAVLFLTHAQPRAWPPEDVAFIREVGTRVAQAAERRRAARALQALADSLEAQVQERGAQLLSAESALRQSQKMEAVGQLTGGLAHDLNNLLAAISGSFEVLQRKRPDPASAEFERMLQIGRSATKKAGALTHRLLAFSRQQALQPRRLSVNRLVLGLEDLVRRTMGPNITLEVAAAPELWNVEVDPNQLENSLLNLCINSRDAMPQGGRVRITTANHWIDETAAAAEGISAGQYVSMCVSDEGTGMPPEVMARAFDPFYSTKPVGVGTGLGLSMVYGFAKQSQGYARIQSEVGRGTTVCLYLPRTPGEDEGAEEDRLVAVSDGAGRGKTVMLVDDEDAVRELVASTLRDAGYRVVEASDGLQATDLLQALKCVDILVTDVGLPGGMGGRQVAEVARRAHPALPVLYITGYAGAALQDAGRLDPGFHLLAKPFELTELIARVRLALDGGADAAACGGTPAGRGQ